MFDGRFCRQLSVAARAGMTGLRLCDVGQPCFRSHPSTGWAATAAPCGWCRPPASKPRPSRPSGNKCRPRQLGAGAACGQGKESPNVWGYCLYYTRFLPTRNPRLYWVFVAVPSHCVKWANQSANHVHSGPFSRFENPMEGFQVTAWPPADAFRDNWTRPGHALAFCYENPYWVFEAEKGWKINPKIH